jgi:hypothetical protein
MYHNDVFITLFCKKLVSHMTSLEFRLATSKLLSLASYSAEQMLLKQRERFFFNAFEESDYIRTNVILGIGSKREQFEHEILVYPTCTTFAANCRVWTVQELACEIMSSFRLPANNKY